MALPYLLLPLGSVGQAPTPTPTPVVTTSPGGVGVRAWRDHYKKLPKKKKKLVDELDEMLLELRSKIEEQPPEEVEPEWVSEFRRAEAWSQSQFALDATNIQLAAQIAIIKSIIREIDDEEALLLAIH